MVPLQAKRIARANCDAPWQVENDGEALVVTYHSQTARFDDEAHFRDFVATLARAWHEEFDEDEVRTLH